MESQPLDRNAERSWLGPEVLRPQGAAGPSAPGSLFIYIYSLWKPKPACTCPGPQAPCPCPDWTCGLSLWPGTCLAPDGGATGPDGENMSGPGGAGPAAGPLSVPRLSFLVPGCTLSTLLCPCQPYSLGKSETACYLGMAPALGPSGWSEGIAMVLDSGPGSQRFSTDGHTSHLGVLSSLPHNSRAWEFSR